MRRFDMTRRDLQLEARDKGRPWDAGKNFGFSAPIGPIRPVKQAATSRPADLSHRQRRNETGRRIADVIGMRETMLTSVASSACCLVI